MDPMNGGSPEVVEACHGLNVGSSSANGRKTRLQLVLSTKPTKKVLFMGAPNEFTAGDFLQFLDSEFLQFLKTATVIRTTYSCALSLWNAPLNAFCTSSPLINFMQMLRGMSKCPLFVCAFDDTSISKAVFER
jgi:hypothetical protein